MYQNKERGFYYLNIVILLFSTLLILYGIKGSIQERLFTLQHFSILTLLLFIKTFAFLSAGFLFAILLKKVLKIQKSEDSFSKRTMPFLIAGWVCYFISLFILILKKWAYDRFPLDQPEITYLTLTNVKGAEIDKEIYFEAGEIFFAALVISIVFFLLTFFIQKKNNSSFISSGIIKQININLLYFVFGIIILLCSVFDFSKDLKLGEYSALIKKYSVPAADSEFYRTEYKVPEYDNIIFPEKKKNLIIILMESMESSFADKENCGVMKKNLIPHLTKIAEENIHFSNTEKLGGGTELSGTGWTIAAMTSKFAGLPYNLPGSNNHDHSYFLPGAVTLTDILDHNGYNQLFIFGSDKHFAGRDALLETHGNVQVHDIAWYKENGMLPQDYSVFWGFEDKKLYRFAKNELNNLSKEDKPFMFGLLTVDTHIPSGWQCEDCPQTEDMPIKNTILCADQMVYDFLEWCREQEWYEDTTIVIMGDHLFMANEENTPFDNKAYLTSHRQKNELNSMDGNPRRWLDIFINAAPVTSSDNFKNRKFSSFDMYPTILAALGCEIPQNRLGLGVNLFSEEKTLCERYSEDYINKEIMNRNIQYESMIYEDE